MKNSHQNKDMTPQDRYGLRVAARLSAATLDLPHDISERLRTARLQALGKRQLVAARTAGGIVKSGSAGTLTFGDDDFSWWNRIGSVIPVIALVAGLIVINVVQSENRARELAEVDAALLTDDLPPAAYTDPGFAQFLRSNQDQAE